MGELREITATLEADGFISARTLNRVLRLRSLASAHAKIFEYIAEVEEGIMVPANQVFA
jgi:hypothetical protein